MSLAVCTNRNSGAFAGALVCAATGGGGHGVVRQPEEPPLSSRYCWPWEPPNLVCARAQMTEGVGRGAMTDPRTLTISRHRAIPPISPSQTPRRAQGELVAVVRLLCVVGPFHE